MSSFDITIDDTELQYQFKKLADRGINTRPLMAQLVQQLHFAIDENFEKEGRPQKWRPLQKPRIGKILQKTGRLRRSLTEKYTNTEAIVGTNVKYAPVHQFGSKNIPARPFMVVTQEDVSRFTNVVKRYILDMRK